MEGPITLQVIYTEARSSLSIPTGETIYHGGRTFTGTGTVNFGAEIAGAHGQLVFIIGAPSFMSGGTVMPSLSPAFIDGDRTFLGVRDMGNAVGAEINFDVESGTATLLKDGVLVSVTAGANEIVVTRAGVNQPVAIDAPARIVDGRMYLPARFVLQIASSFFCNSEG